MSKKSKVPVKKKKKFDWFYIALFGLIVLAVILFPFINNSGAKFAIGKPAPDFTLSSLDGKDVSLSSFKGKPVILNFWATWCPPCNLEMPALQKVAEKAEEQGFVVLTVNQQENRSTVSRFIGDKKYTFPVVLDSTGSVSQLYQVNGIPTTVFIDAEGVVRGSHEGAIPIAEQFLAQIPR